MDERQTGGDPDEGTRLDLLKVWTTSPTGVFCAFLVGVVGLLFGAYVFFYQEAKRAELSMAIYDSTDMLSEPARDVGIKLLLGTQAIDPGVTPARVVLVKIWNSGDFPIKAEDIDKDEPFGFRLNAAVLQLDVVHASTQYLKRGLAESALGSGTVLLRRATFEPGESLLVRALVLRQDKEPDDVEPLGKIAGLSEITKRLTVWDPSGLWARGHPTPSQARFQKWAIGALMLVLLAWLAFSIVTQWRSKRARPTD